jgi:hypothetical protein
MPPVEFKPTIPASARPQTYALGRAATGISKEHTLCGKMQKLLYFKAVCLYINHSALKGRIPVNVNRLQLMQMEK